jgi:cysteine desulfurase / selenocysteine lyase
MLTKQRAHSPKVVGLHTKVPVRGGHLATYINFDNAASTPTLQAVLDTVNEFMNWYSSVHRGAGLKSQVATEAYEEARRIVARFVGADLTEHTVIFGKNTTEAINKVSYRLNLRRRDIVITSMLEHHSNDLPWRRAATVKHIKLTPTGEIDIEHLRLLLTRHAGHVKLVAVSGASNVTGYIPDIHAIAQLAHQAGAQILVDGAQLAAHRPIRMGRLNEASHIDYLVLSAHKMYAPFGTGALIGRKDAFAHGAPEYSGGGTVDFVTPWTVDWGPPPDRDEAGSPNVVGAVALAKAAKVLQQTSLHSIARHEAGLIQYALTKMAHIPQLTIYGSADPDQSRTRSGVIPFNVGSLPPHLVAAILSEEWGIGVRSGCFCAHPYVMDLLAVTPKERRKIRSRLIEGDKRHMPGMVRVSFGMYNTIDEVDRLIKALKAITRGRYGEYNHDPATGAYHLRDQMISPSRFFTI